MIPKKKQKRTEGNENKEGVSSPNGENDNKFDDTGLTEAPKNHPDNVTGTMKILME